MGRLWSVPFFVCLIIQSYVYSKNYNYDIIKYGYNLRKDIEVLYIENKYEEDVYGIQLQ